MERDLELEKKIDAYIKGKLSEEEARELWKQLFMHPEYIELLETELGLRSILSDRTSGEDSDQSEVQESTIIYSLQKSWKWIAAAASVAILVAAINLLQIDTNQSINELAVGQIDISSHLVSAPVLRSQKDSISPTDSLLNRGFEAAISGDIPKALEIYDQIIVKYSDKPAAVQAHLNTGIIQYNSGKFRNAIASFKQVVKQVQEEPISKEKAYWYMGNAYMHVNKLQEARDAIHKTYTLKGIYRQPAYRILQKLDHELGNKDFDELKQ